MSRAKEIAKFACGAEALHAFAHLVLACSGTNVTVLGITTGPTWRIVGLALNAVVSVILGVYAWGSKHPGASSPR